MNAPERIISSVFVHFGEGRIIKTSADEKIRCLTQQKGGKTGVNEVRRLLTDAMNANEAHILRAKEEF